MKKVALLATGDEITNGVILNTNGQVFAQKLAALGIAVGSHAVTADTNEDIISTLHFLLDSHDAVILTGGLGPTCDDRTRFALAEALNLPLEFHHVTWQRIVERLTAYGMTVPECNRQQAMLPQGSHAIINAFGTAGSCWLDYNGKIIFMLPGPPTECLPMLSTVEDVLIERGFKHQQSRQDWLLFGLSEGHLAEYLDKLKLPEGAHLGYRYHYPYIDLKLFAKTDSDLEIARKQVEPFIQDNIASTDGLKYSQNLCEKIQASHKPFRIHDTATAGRLSQVLLIPATKNKLEFSSHEPLVTVSGLDEYWQQKETAFSLLNLTVGNKAHSKELLYAGRDRVLDYATEYACKVILEHWSSI